MIAKSGAGPEPLPPRCMTIDTLAESIRFLMREETSFAAEHLAERMDHEQGVQAAVNSFHRHLPLETMQCDLIPDQPAVWTIKSGRRQVKMSRLAAEIAISQRSSLQKDLKTWACQYPDNRVIADLITDTKQSRSSSTQSVGSL